MSIAESLSTLKADKAALAQALRDKGSGSICACGV